jgi:putative Mg2+ transporter-C (MgtC) family protein
VPSQWDLVIRLLLAAGLAGLLGIERELHEQPAGFRTHTLVGLGAALFAIVSAFGFQAVAGAGPSGEIRADVTRVASQIVVGIGFLGGGAIIKYGASVRGLTTAASLWVTAAVGTAVGIGMRFLATATTLITLVALVVLRPLRGFLRQVAGSHVELLVQTDADGHLGLVRSALAERGVALSSVEVTGQDGEGRSYSVLARLPRGLDPANLVADMQEEPHIVHIDWNR